MNEKLKVPELNITEKLVKTLYIMFNMYINSFKKTVFFRVKALRLVSQ